MTYHTFSGSQVWTHTLILHYVCVSKYNVNAECLIEQSRRQRGSASSGRSPQSLWRVSNRGITSARKLPPTIAHWQLNIWNIPIGTLFFILQGCFRWLIIRHTHTHTHTTMALNFQRSIVQNIAKIQFMQHLTVKIGMSEWKWMRLLPISGQWKVRKTLTYLLNFNK